MHKYEFEKNILFVHDKLYMQEYIYIKRTDNSKQKKKKIEKLAVFIDFIFIKKWRDFLPTICSSISHYFESVNIYFKQFRHSWTTTRWNVYLVTVTTNSAEAKVANIYPEKRARHSVKEILCKSSCVIATLSADRMVWAFQKFFEATATDIFNF